MPFAPFPDATYLTDAARTEGEMKTAFENWLLASKQMEHGQCRLVYESPTVLRLIPWNGRRVLVNHAPFAVPSAGLTITNAGMTANQLHYIYLSDEAGDGNCILKQTQIIAGVVRSADPDSGVGMISIDSGATRLATSTVVGLAVPLASGFSEGLTVSLFQRRLGTPITALAADFPGFAAASPTSVIGVAALGFAGDTLLAQAQLVFEATGATLMVAAGYTDGAINGQAALSATTGEWGTIPVIWSVPLTTDRLVTLDLRAWIGAGAPANLKTMSRLAVTRLG